MLKKKREQMLLLKTVFTFQLPLKTNLLFPFKNILLRKISCKVSGCALICLTLPKPSGVQNPQEIPRRWTTTRTRGLAAVRRCRQTVGGGFAGGGPPVPPAPGCVEAALVARVVTATSAWFS